MVATGPPKPGPATRIGAARAAIVLRYHALGDRLAVKGTDVALVVVLLLAAVFYEWTAQTSVSGSATSLYYLLAGSLLHVHLYVPIPVPAGLEALKDPYNPVANAPFQAYGIHDLALYHGLFYSTWGPTPAVVLYLPLRLLGIELTDAAAAPIFAFLALAFAVLLLRFIVRRFLRATPGWAVVLGACVLAFGTAVPFMLRRPAIYEVAISCGACFMFASLYLLARGLLAGGPPRMRLLAAASLCMGLAFGARPPLLLGGVVFLVAAIILWRRHAVPAPTRRRIVLALLGPLGACVILMAAYNIDRFGSPTQFGIRYQLAGVETRTKSTFELSYVPPGVYNFALAPPRLALTFPHVFLPPPPAYPGTLPAGYDGTTQPAEPTGGLIPMAPIVLFALAAWTLWRRKRQLGGSELPLIIGALTLLGAGILVGLAFTLWGTTERYEVDFDLLIILAGVLGWLGLLAVSEMHRRLVAVVGAVTVAWSCFTGVAVSFTGYYNLLDAYHPQAFDNLEDLTGPLATLPTMLLGHAVLARVQSPEPVISPPVTYTTFDDGGSSTYLGGGPVLLIVLSPGSGMITLQAKMTSNKPFSARAPLWISVQSSGRKPASVPVRPGQDRIPIHVGWGLNRITLNLTSSDPGNTIIGMGVLTLGGAPTSHARYHAAPQRLVSPPPRGQRAAARRTPG
ncbi:MAG: hypothetical protein ABSG64_07320 [Solirubrobacteraceae bacterium]